MKTKFNPLALMALGIILLPSAFAQGTAFTYQGRLNSGASPANGSYDLTFALFSVNSGAGQVGNTITNPAVAVSNGLFTVLLDFGNQFPGANRWLEIGVRTNGAAAYTTLTPRQPITPAPYAIFAADAAEGGPWSLNGSNIFYNSGNVGVGTSSPSSPVHIKSGGEGIRIDGQSVGAANSIYMGFRDSNGTRIGYVGDASSSDQSIYLESDYGDVVLYTSAGRVLAARSDGRVALGSSGQLLAPAGEENLRIIRGVVSGAGGIIVGSGFTVSHGAAGSGQYTVTFNTAFSGAPAVTATADLNGRLISTVGVLSSSANFQTRDVVAGVATDAAFHFIAIGPR